LPPTWRPALRGVVSKVRDFLDVLGLPATDALTSVCGCYRLGLPGTTAGARAGDGEAAERLAATLRPWAGHHLAAGPVYLGGYAAMLRANARPGDRERAQAYDGTAQAMARLLGLALPAG